MPFLTFNVFFRFFVKASFDLQEESFFVSWNR